MAQANGTTKRKDVDTAADHDEHVNKKAKTSADNKMDAFLQVFEELAEDILQDMNNRPGISQENRDELVSYYRKCLHYTVPGGKLTRGLTVIKGCETLMGKLSEDQLRKASILGWCVEWLQATFLVADDVMDKSVTRRGAPCWYKRPEVTEANAVNDALMLMEMIFQIVRKHFRDEPSYVPLVELIHDTAFQTEVGQHLDTNGTPFDKELDLNRFTLERYKAVVRYKTAYYSFYLPCALAMTYAGETEVSRFQTAEAICMELGEYFQIQDDVLDCFGEPEQIGKVGTDIQDAKCSWLVCQALLRVTEAQRKTLEENYGKWDDESVGKVKQVYRELDLENAFGAYEEEANEKITKLIGTVQPENMRPLFEFLLGKIYKRQK
eukprot:c34396_g1_i1.p1 GENE.c34396_g1_i1~~c34396_g1_i1.p1  ORF type:complete len:380 (+),score=107.14 c34396_g1_i1:92-1231(+)